MLCRAKFAVCSEVHTERIKYNVGRMWNFGMINEAVRTVTARLQRLKTDSHIACRAHAVPFPCRAAKVLECVFPI